MKRTLVVNLRIDVRDMATLLKGALDAGLLSESATPAAPSGVSLANVIRVAVGSAVGALPEQREEFERSVTKAWNYLIEHGIGVRQTPRDDDGQPILELVGLAASRAAEASPSGPTFDYDEVLKAMEGVG